MPTAVGDGWSQVSGLKSQVSPGNDAGTSLQHYFRSGWAFLIPYLAAYLLYAWLRWPVNPAGVVNSQLSALSSQPSSLLPPLLHVYWLFHLLHLALGAYALRDWWLVSGTKPLSGDRLLSTVYGLLPWIFLGLLFWIPGVYMEFPADPWHHYARVNEWSWLQTVTEHSAWKKSSYFLAYSLIGQLSPPLFQLKWFDVYYTGCCLLLCWQYFRLARAVGLGDRASFLFVLLNTLLFGNNLFGFYRYYGMSSTLFAQLGAVALTRIALKALRKRDAQVTANYPSSSPAALPLDEPRHSPALVEWATAGASCLALLALTAFNHVQGLGIAGLGIAAVVVWRLIEWRPSMRWWLAGSAIILSMAAIRWYPRHPALDEVYRPGGWLTAWYGFNFFSSTSPALARFTEIVNLTGVFNIAAAILLLRRNHVAAWLTLSPVIALSLPCIAIPLSTALASRNVGEIITYHRMLFAIPAGLALATLGAGLVTTGKPAGRDLSYPRLAFPLLLLGAFILILTPATRPGFGYLFSMFMRPPDDLRMRPALETPPDFDAKPPGARQVLPIVATTGLGSAMTAVGTTGVIFHDRLTVPTSVRAGVIQNEITKAAAGAGPLIVALPLANELYTPYSQLGYLSRHWLPHIVALQHLGRAELENAALYWHFRKIEESTLTYYVFPPKSSPPPSPSQR